MTVITIMAHALDQELQNRGIFAASRADCEAIMAAVFERFGKIAAVAARAEGAELPRRTP